jgi:hypothetical protein
MGKSIGKSEDLWEIYGKIIFSENMGRSIRQYLENLEDLIMGNHGVI